MKRLLISIVVLGLTVSAAGAQTAPAACNRECLAGFITQYLDAMLKHKPDALPVSKDMKFTEDTVVMKLGEGLWKNISKLRTYRLDFLDVAEGMAASHVIVEEGAMPVMLGIRMKIVDKKIAEIETMVTRTRTEGAIFVPDNLKTVRPEMLVVPPADKRMSRAELIRIAEFYPLGLKVGGNFNAVKLPFAPGAYRLENGQLMGGPGSRGGGDIGSSTVSKHPDVSYRVAAVDEEMGVVLMRLDFGDTNNYGPGNALTCFEAFKVYGGQMHAVEAFIRIMKANTPSGWDDRYPVKKPV